MSINKIKKNNLKPIVIILAITLVGTIVLVAARATTTVDIGASIKSSELAISGPIQRCDEDFILFGNNFDAACREIVVPPQQQSSLAGLSSTEPSYSRYSGIPSAQLDFNALTRAADRADNGASPQGQFRTNCQFSHLNYDDPIFFPGQPGKAHLHMYFGNTSLNAFTTAQNVAQKGGGSCDGGELNRTGYWIPALHDAQNRVRVPDRVIIYYKTRSPAKAQRMPQGLELVSGEHVGIGTANWACGENGFHRNAQKTIPQCSDTLHAGVTFPQCWDGKNLKSSDHISHMRIINEANQSCPSSHPVLLPQIEVLVYWRNPGNTSGWYISSDRHNGANSAPGSTLHSDWFGGWDNSTMDIWTNNCIKNPRNCSGGQLGINRSLSPVKDGNQYQGPKILTLP